MKIKLKISRALSVLLFLAVVAGFASFAVVRAFQLPTMVPKRALTLQQLERATNLETGRTREETRIIAVRSDGATANFVVGTQGPRARTITLPAERKKLVLVDAAKG